jgi:hypothetical protein
MATLVVNRGKEIICDRLMGAGTEPKYIAWGTGAGTAAAADTTLFTEGPESRTTGTSSKVTTTTTNDTYQVTGTITASGARTVTNAGTFDVVTSSSGNMFVKGDFTGVVLATNDSIAFTIKVQFS